MTGLASMFRADRASGSSGRVGAVGLILLAGLTALALFPEQLAPYDPSELVGRPLEPPSAEFLLGTNDIGQDLLSELIAGARVSLTTALIVAAVSLVVGVLVGVVSGYVRGIVQEALLRLIDLTLVVPFLPLVILLSAYLGPGQRNVILVLSLVLWAAPARFIRSRVLSLAAAPYVEAAVALGADPVRIMLKHIWPGVRTLALVQFILVASTSILAEASLSFLGLGDPSTKSWGTMLFFARASGAFLSEAWRWWVLPTGIMITLSVLCLVLLGYGLEKRFEPGLQR